MSEKPLPKLDPERLKEERKDVDLGARDETDFGSAQNPSGDAAQAAVKPAAGATPPPR